MPNTEILISSVKKPSKLKSRYDWSLIFSQFIIIIIILNAIIINYRMIDINIISKLFYI